MNYNQANPEHPISYVNESEISLLGKLVSGECDAAILPSSYLATDEYDLSSLHCSVISDLAENYYCQGYKFGYRVDEPEINSLICEELDKIAETGIWNELSIKYFGIDLSVPAGDFEYITGDEERYAELQNELFAGSSGTESAGGEAAVQEDVSTGGETAVQEGDSEGDSAVVPADDAAGESAGTPVVYTDANTVYYVQQALNDAGFNCGAPDGSKGNMTNQAIIQYKAANGLDASNADITDELLIKLGLK